jgi:hypothetical protein
MDNEKNLILGTSTKYEEMDKESQAWMTKRTFNGLIYFAHQDCIVSLLCDR